MMMPLTNDDSTGQQQQAKRLVSVLESETAFNIKHPLQYVWTLWVKKDRPRDAHSASHQAEEWQASLDRIVTLNSVEDFWCLFNNIPNILDIELNSDYFFFKDGISPRWEDERHLQGSMLSVVMDKQDEPALWLQSLLALVGCTLEQHAHVTGLAFQRRGRGNRLQLWMDTVDNEIVKSIERDYRRALTEGIEQELHAALRLSFTPFKAYGGHGSGSGHGGGSGHGSGHGGHHGGRQEASNSGSSVGQRYSTGNRGMSHTRP